MALVVASALARVSTSADIGVVAISVHISGCGRRSGLGVVVGAVCVGAGVVEVRVLLMLECCRCPASEVAS